jgi:hypothetical protein
MRLELEVLAAQEAEANQLFADRYRIFCFSIVITLSHYFLSQQIGRGCEREKEIISWN